MFGYPDSHQPTAPALAGMSGLASLSVREQP